MKIIITNKEKYNETVIDVDLTGLRGGNDYKGNFYAVGTISIEIEEVGWRDWIGEHGSHDYEDDYGFILVDDSKEPKMLKSLKEVTSVNLKSQDCDYKGHRLGFDKKENAYIIGSHFNSPVQFYETIKELKEYLKLL